MLLNKRAEPKRICVTGAAGRIAYSLIQSLAKGDVFGYNQPLILHLLDIEKSYEALEGIALEIQDLASNVVMDCMVTTSVEEALTGADIAILIASHPHLPGMERADLLRANTKIFKETGQALERVAKRSIKVLVVANPCNTNALVTMTYAPSIPRSQFTGLSMLDHNRTVAQVSRRMKVSANDVRNIVVWGNHSQTMFSDLGHASLRSPAGEWTPLPPLRDWARSELLDTVRNRYKEIMERRGMTTMSTGKAIADHLRSWMQGTPAECHVSMAVPSGGEYGVPEGVFFSFPVTVTEPGSCKVSVKEGLPLDQFSKDMLARSYQELKLEAVEALRIAEEE